MYSDNHLGAVLRAASTGREDAVFAWLPDGRGQSYCTFFQQAERMAARLLALGLLPGDRVAVQVPKSIEALQLYVGTILAGGVFLPLNTDYTPAELSYFISNSEPRILVVDPAAAPVLAPLAREAGVSQLLTLDADGGGSLVAGLAPAPDFRAIPRGAGDLAAILYTSGTTGRSKGAMLSHENLSSNALTLRDHWGFTAEDTLIHALPIFHTHGLFVATNIVLTAGCAMRFFPRFDAAAIVQAMPVSTALMGVPTFYVRLLKEEGLSAAAAGMRLFVSGSAPLLDETHARWQAATGHAILERYGMTETNMNTSNPYDGERRAGTVGLPLPGVDLRIVDAAGSAVPAGEPGVIEVRGPNVFMGYWQMPEKTAEEFRDDGYFITGDIARQAADGYVSIIGRAKDLIISGGYNVYPKEIELLIDALDGVNECAVIGVPHPDFGEGVVAVVDRSGDIGAEDIQSAIAPDLARYKQPKMIVFVDALPRNTMGKVQKNLLRNDYAAVFDA